MTLREHKPDGHRKKTVQPAINTLAYRLPLVIIGGEPIKRVWRALRKNRSPKNYRAHIVIGPIKFNLDFGSPPGELRYYLWVSSNYVSRYRVCGIFQGGWNLKSRTYSGPMTVPYAKLSRAPRKLHHSASSTRRSFRALRKRYS